MRSSKVKGKIFEWFVQTILLKCGFSEVQEDGLLIYRRGQERMVHGLAQPHDADVLMRMADVLSMKQKKPVKFQIIGSV